MLLEQIFEFVAKTFTVCHQKVHCLTSCPQSKHVTYLPTISLGKLIHKLMHRDIRKSVHLQLCHPKDLPTLLPVPKPHFDGVLELSLDQPNRIVAPGMPDWILDQDLVELLAVRQSDLQRVRRGPFFLRIVVVGRELRVFFQVDSLPQRLDAGVPRPGGVVLVVARFDHGALEEDHGDHVLHAVVAVRGVVQRALLVDDDHGGLLGLDADVGDILSRIEVPRAQDVADLLSGFDARGTVPFDGVDLEEDVLNHPALERARKLELLSFEEGVVEAPSRGRQYGWGSRLAILREEGQVHGAHAGVAGCPAFTGSGVGGLAKGA